MSSKKWYKSKTIWVNGLTAIAGLLTYVIGPVLPPGFQVYLTGIVVPMINVMLRFLTTAPILKSDDNK